LHGDNLILDDDLFRGGAEFEGESDAEDFRSSQGP
jgi:hypothetical protein